ncbi:hypothetical protein [Photobacterium damselae]|uniref:hypothetical protein n=1 Tax=Photobacterium damselae TaxID=38293 RepID=UPI000D9379FD|nr:hypothetical protein [Photobacterium damselae]NVO73218.1 hypothetical protein [Photobacterium damselae subsp. damselae]TGZ34023.1 hypothetical protein EQ875_02589 [Photobacterium damselae subsp. damselae]UKA28967.1 hypothetical protein IPQ37_13230 [Photobacterium damselae subsp. damselae]SPY31595.1 Uncharacterised protein [Photobacterium damselae]
MPYLIVGGLAMLLYGSKKVVDSVGDTAKKSEGALDRLLAITVVGGVAYVAYKGMK